MSDTLRGVLAFFGASLVVAGVAAFEFRLGLVVAGSLCLALLWIGRKAGAG